MSLRLVMHAFLAWSLLPTSLSRADTLAAGLMTCREVVSDAARLACYDGLAPTVQGERFTGKGSGITPEFTVETPRLMRFDSADVIMVVYLLDDSGAVVQNLHRGGAGGGEFLIENPGRYHLQVNASGAWSVTVLP
ncbi:hypothetical protein [Primorskyibacter flagellatus]|jgi:hypothetical protein|uniref:hypothetical protein n=1 Tax=Primorskyibacter flagellatus TaxID=1387277 RepID=UPI003A9078B4